MKQMSNIWFKRKYFFTALIPISLFFIFTSNAFAATSADITARMNVCHSTTTCAEQEEEPVVTPPSTEVVVESFQDGPIVGFQESPILDLKAGSYSATIHVETDRPVKYFIYLGETVLLESGLIDSGKNFEMSQDVLIPNLYPDKVYYYRVELRDAFNNRSLSNTKMLTTRFTDLSPLQAGNVTGLTYEILQKDVLLRWNPPAISDYYIRIVRSNKFYPLDILDGDALYQGRQQVSFLDKYIMNLGDKFYYTVFVCAFDNLCSTGSSIAVSAATSSVAVGGVPSEAGGGGVVKPQKEAPTPVPGEKAVKIERVRVFHGQKEIVPQNGIFNVNTGDSIKIFVKTSGFPEDIKVVTVADEKSPIFYYLAQFDEKKSSFVTSDFIIKDNGDYSFVATALDQTKEPVVSQSFKIVVKPILEDKGRGPFCPYTGLGFITCIFFYLLLLSTILFFLYWLIIKRHSIFLSSVSKIDKK